MSMPEGINYFKEYKGECKIFVEGGTYKGHGMLLAREAGFHEIHSIDIVDQEEIVFKYDGVGTAKRYIDDTRNVFPWLLPRLTEKTMFWLDSHSMLTEGELENYPLLDELRLISDHCPVPCTILIDDYLYMSHELVTGWDHDMIVKAIMDINPRFTIRLLPNPIKNNILLAYV